MKASFLFLASLLNIQAFSQPVNDLCTNATTLTPATTCSYTTGTFSGSSISSAAPSCANDASQDLWYKFIATDPTMSVLLDGQAGLYQAFEIFEGSCTGTSVRCDNDNQGPGFGESYLANNFTVGTTYYVRVLNTESALSTSPIEICIRKYPTPSNDLCTNATTLTPANTCSYTTGTFSGSSISSAAPSCANDASQDVWYKFIATDPTMSVLLDGQAGLYQAFEIFEGSCTGTSVRCDNDNQGPGFGESYLANNFTVGTTYYVRVLNTESALSTSPIEICIRKYPTPSNDLCTNATTLTPANTCSYTTGTFSGSSISSAAPSCANDASQDVWYKFIATDPTMSVLLDGQAGLYQAFEIFEGSCTGTSVRCDNDNQGPGFGESYLANNFTVGTTYYVRVLNTESALSTSPIEICIRKYPTPSNDLCTNATTLTPATTCSYTTGTFSGSSISSAAPSCANDASQDVWYKFVATDPTMSVLLDGQAGLYQAFEIFEGSCTGTSVRCDNDNQGPGFGESYLANNFTVGTTYYVRVLNTESALSTSPVEICVQGPPPATCTPTIAISSNISSICQGAQVVFSSSISNGGTAPAYQWKKNGNNVGTGLSTYTTSTLNNNDVITCLMNSNEACASPATAISNALTMQVNPVVSPSFTTVSPICTGEAFSLPNVSNNGITGTWLPAINNTQTTTYTFTPNTNQCASPTNLSVQVNSVNVSVSVLGYTLTANETAATYQWVDCNNANTPIAGETSASFSPSVSGDYAVRITKNNCTEISTCTNVIVQSVGFNQTTQNPIAIFPNPAQEVLLIEGVLGPLCYEIYNPMGQMVQQNCTEDLVSIASLPNGVYRIRINNTHILPFIKNN